VRKVRHADGRVHFSCLKKFTLSALHYRCACEGGVKATRPMNVGSVAHALVLGEKRRGRPLTVYPGERKGNAWKDFAAQAMVDGKEVVTVKEYEAARPIADAIIHHPLACELLNGAKLEVPMQWETAGVECATDGVDILGPDYLAELKTTHTAEPERFKRHALAMLWHAQLAWLSEGSGLNGLIPKRHLIIAAEVTPPFPVTVLELEPELLLHGAKSVTLWLEKLRACEETDLWPAYTQSIVPFPAPEWLSGQEEDDDEETLVWPVGQAHQPEAEDGP
jgi:hypothetical protein